MKLFGAKLRSLVYLQCKHNNLQHPSKSVISHISMILPALHFWWFAAVLGELLTRNDYTAKQPFASNNPVNTAATTNITHVGYLEDSSDVSQHPFSRPRRLHPEKITAGFLRGILSQNVQNVLLCCLNSASERVTHQMRFR